MAKLSSLSKVAEISSSSWDIAKHRLEIHFHVERKQDFSEEFVKRAGGKESANESSVKLFPTFDSTFIGSSQHVFVLPVENSDAEWGRNDNLRSASLMVHHPWDLNFEDIKKVAEVLLIDVEKLRLDNSSVLRWMFSGS
ncbi:hypothetical protein Tco_0281127 [Tanacetum coccineum]